MSKASRRRRKKKRPPPEARGQSDRGATDAAPATEARADPLDPFEPAPADLPAPRRPVRRQRWLSLATLVILLGLGGYLSVRYYKHLPVPHPDFAAFAPVGHDLLAGRMPRTFMRAPVVGLLQAGLSKAVAPWQGEDDPHPDLTAGRLLNALLHPINVVLIWLIGRQLIGRWGVWLAVVAAINPCQLLLVVHPIAETVLLFFVLTSFYFIFRRSRWAYLFAALATMTRYEGAALILAAFVVDMIHRKGLRRKLAAVGLAALASLPLALWMLGTYLTWKTQGLHYLKVLKYPSRLDTAILEHLKVTWQVAIMPLLRASDGSLGGSEAAIVHRFTIVLASCLFLVGLGWGIYSRQGNLLALMIFLVLYLAVHVLHPWMDQRFCVPFYWIILLICAYGARGIWRLADRKHRAFRIGRLAFLALLAGASVYWLVRMWPGIAAVAPVSTNSAHVAYVAGAAGAAVVALRVALGLGKPIVQLLSVSLVALVMVFSNQFFLAAAMRNGDRWREFEVLLDWYRRNAGNDEVLATTLSSPLRAMAPRYADRIVHPRDIPGRTLLEFARACRQRNVTYVAWDSRIGLLGGNEKSPPDRWYQSWRMRRLQVLMEPRTVGPFAFVLRIQNRATGQYIHLFRLGPPAPRAWDSRAAGRLPELVGPAALADRRRPPQRRRDAEKTGVGDSGATAAECAAVLFGRRRPSGRRVCSRAAHPTFCRRRG